MCTLEVPAARVEENIGDTLAVDLVEQDVKEASDLAHERRGIVYGRGALLDIDQRVCLLAVGKELLNVRVREVGSMPCRQHRNGEGFHGSPAV